MERVEDIGVLEWLVERLPPVDPEAQHAAAKAAIELSESLGIPDGSVASEAEWVEAECVSWCGLDARGWDADVLILHAMYETDAEPTRHLTRDETRAVEMETFAGWRRVRWHEYWTRLGLDPSGFTGYPDGRWLPPDDGDDVESKGVVWPSEGGLDRKQFARLVDHLAVASADGLDAVCYAYLAMGPTGLDEAVYCGSLGELSEFRDGLDDASPNNVWPEDRSWLVYTDYDYWATKVSGAHELINALVGDAELETTNARGNRSL